jgi:hypothetical protein
MHFSGARDLVSWDRNRHGDHLVVAAWREGFAPEPVAVGGHKVRRAACSAEVMRAMRCVISTGPP